MEHYNEQSLLATEPAIPALSCGQWGYGRTYMAENQDWAEPEFTPVSCATPPSSQLEQVLQNSSQILYQHWLVWR